MGPPINLELHSAGGSYPIDGSDQVLLEIRQPAPAVSISRFARSVLFALHGQSTGGVSGLGNKACKLRELTNMTNFSAKVGYTVSMIGFALITVYMIFAAGMSTSRLTVISCSSLLFCLFKYTSL